MSKLILLFVTVFMVSANAMWVDPEQCHPTTYKGSSTWNVLCNGDNEEFINTVTEDYNTGRGKKYLGVKRWMLRVKQAEWSTHWKLKWLPYEGPDATRTINLWVGIKVNWKKFTNKRLDEAYRCQESVRDVWGRKAVYTSQGQCVVRLTRIQISNIKYSGTSGKGVNGKKHYTADKATVRYFWRAIEMGDEEPSGYNPPQNGNILL